MNFKENQNSDYESRIKYSDYNLKVVVTKEAYTDRDALNQDVDLARKIAIQKIQNNEFTVSDDAYKVRYISIKSEDVRKYRNSQN
jgi:hypothetical protein